MTSAFQQSIDQLRGTLNQQQSGHVNGNQPQQNQTNQNNSLPGLNENQQKEMQRFAGFAQSETGQQCLELLEQAYKQYCVQHGGG